MDIRAAILYVICHMILSESADPKKNTTEYIGCYKHNSTTFRWENSSVLINVNFTSDMYQDCQSKARVQGLLNIYTYFILFIINFPFSFNHVF